MQSKLAVPGRKALQAEVTRKDLLAAARELFTERGYADTNTPEIVRRAGVTRGALYHHFRDKKDLLRAVGLELATELAGRVRDESRRAKSEGPTARLFAGLRSFLDALRDPAVRRILMLDGPSVAGVEEWRSAVSDAFLCLIRDHLRDTIDAGEIEEQPLEPLARLLLAALLEAGFYVAHAEDPEKADAEVVATLGRLWRGLRVERDTGA